MGYLKGAGTGESDVIKRLTEDAKSFTGDSNLFKLAFTEVLRSD